jgi:hypothetical protein
LAVLRDYCLFVLGIGIPRLCCALPKALEPPSFGSTSHDTGSQAQEPN